MYSPSSALRACRHGVEEEASLRLAAGLRPACALRALGASRRCNLPPFGRIARYARLALRAADKHRPSACCRLRRLRASRAWRFAPLTNTGLRPVAAFGGYALRAPGASRRCKNTCPSGRIALRAAPAAHS